MHMIEDMTLHQEGLISHIPKLVYGVNMGDFADTYNGDIKYVIVLSWAVFH